ncbi:Sporulation/nuclear morphology Spo7 [Penicillium bovifimosum]|uniref:Sporulation/nuclear morphology Spo7 n=1 Tax=Penicillium bovifimosum TaxID=126998 RepID=A0A9W9H9Y6_9EURO|nr:Sporulation/nuclear morphology Spo7 [Penicillium bovifimosum]KAJ5142779.1 Sporulation/nuclear morphology Spo7 [Penicillium bovifimosum]
MASPLDQVVKGAPAPGARALTPEPLNSQSSQAQTPPDRSSTPRPATPDPLATLPSSPPQIYLNLLILETSLRAQYLALRERRRQNTFFILLLTVWLAYFSYALFLRPREDGRGVGGSVYWVVDIAEKVALLGGVVTALLVWGTGQWERGIRWPRRWLAVSNRGLRVMNTKIIIIRGPFWQELLSYISFLFPFSLPFLPSPNGNYQYVDPSLLDKRPATTATAAAAGSRQHYQQYYNGAEIETGLVEEDLSPGGDYIRLLLLPKSFSPEFRENWDDYRTEFWEKENERRAQLRIKLREREKRLAQEEGSWLGRLGLGWRASQRRRLLAGTLHRPLEPEFKHRLSHHHHSISKSHEHRASSSRRNTRSDSHSRTSSRSTTPVDAGHDDRPPSRSSTTRPRRSSTASGQDASPQQRNRKSSTLRRGLSPLTQAQIREGVRTPSFSSDDSALPGGVIEKDREEAIPASVSEL